MNNKKHNWSTTFVIGERVVVFPKIRRIESFLGKRLRRLTYVMRERSATCPNRKNITPALGGQVIRFWVGIPEALYEKPATCREAFQRHFEGSVNDELEWRLRCLLGFPQGNSRLSG
jgi:hypothetical protein